MKDISREEVANGGVNVREPLMARLGVCQQCGKNEAKYTCPCCSTKTCCLECVNRHKRELQCDGIRNKTAYKAVSQFTELDLLSDYRLLEEVGRQADKFNRDESKRHTRFKRDLPLNLHKLRCAASKRGIQLRFQPANFSRSRANTTYLDWKTQKIEWRVEWRFVPPSADDQDAPDAAAADAAAAAAVVVVDDRLAEEVPLRPVLHRHLQENPQLRLSRPTGEEMLVFLAAEHVAGESGRFYAIDVDLSLGVNLKDKLIIEYPVFHVVAARDRADYPLVASGPPVTAATGPARAKKAKLTFYEVSDGEVTDSD